MIAACVPATAVAALLGGIRHTRHVPPTRQRSTAQHSFAYPTCFLALRMAPALSAAEIPRGLGWNRRAWLGFNDKDHGRGDGCSIDWVRKLLAQTGINHATGELWLYTLPRCLGMCFKPVSFWLCLNPAGQVQAVVCEVNNTFGERHAYVLHDPGGQPLHSGQTLMADKQFHVSPFLVRQGQYVFRFWFGPTKFMARIVHQMAANDADSTLLSTAMHGDFAALTPQKLRSLRFRYALQSVAIVARIHWQALRLWCQGLPWQSRPCAFEPAVTVGVPAEVFTAACLSSDDPELHSHV